MAQVRINISSCLISGKKNVNDWFANERSQIGLENFSAVVDTQKLVIWWKSPNSSTVYDLIIPVLNKIKELSTPQSPTISFITGTIESDFQINLDCLSEGDAKDTSLYPYLYTIDRQYIEKGVQSNVSH